MPEVALRQTIEAETAADHPWARALLRDAFGGEDEAQLVDDLRVGGHIALAFVAATLMACQVRLFSTIL